jgi:hypothetical protein
MSTQQSSTNVSATPKKKPVFLIRYFTIAYGILWIIPAIYLSGAFVWYWYTIMGLCLLLMFFWLYRLNKKGWALLMLNFTYYAVSLTYWMAPTFSEKPLVFDRHVDFEHLFVVFLCGLVFYFFNRKNVLSTFQVSRRFQIWTLVISLVTVIIYIYLDWDEIIRDYY